MEMGLAHDQFLLVQAGTKTIEIRLNDQKRPQLEVGDQIVFEDLATQQQVTKKVTQLEKFGTFSQLYQQYQGTAVGSAPTETDHAQVPFPCHFSPCHYVAKSPGQT